MVCVSIAPICRVFVIPCSLIRVIPYYICIGIRFCGMRQYQISGDTIVIYMNDSTIDYAHVIQYAFAVQHLDSTYYNQLKGNDLKAYFEGQAVRQIDVEGNAESIFYPLDNGAMIGFE